MLKNYLVRFAESVSRPVAVAGSVFLCLLFGLSLPVLARESKDPVFEAADSFFELRDAGSFQQAWWEGSEVLHLTTKLDHWVEDVRIQSELLGAAAERSLKSVSHRASMPGLPDGEYQILLYDARYERKRAALEILVFVRDAYGDWRLISYRLS